MDSLQHFGGEHSVTNTCPQNYKFTGKERDTETGLDDFEARYYSSQFGRFHSADWSAIPVPVPYADLGNPQTLNLYAYVKNNPLNLTDPTGHLATGQLGSLEGLSVTPRLPPGNGIAEPYINVDPPSESALEAMAVNNAIAIAQLEAQQQAQPQQQPTTLNLGGTKVNVTLSAAEIDGGKGVVINANPQGCDNCRWAQTVTRTGDPTLPTQTDREAKSGAQPLYPPGDRINNFWDAPNTHKGSAGGTFTAVTTLGVADKNSKTFKVLGSMTWGYKVDKSGNVTPIGPRIATRAEQARSIAVLRRDSSTWTVGP